MTESNSEYIARLNEAIEIARQSANRVEKAFDRLDAAHDAILKRLRLTKADSCGGLG